MNKKGFTLIELLAVIVILAVIALIATPVIMNAISNAKQGAWKDAAYGIVKATENTFAKGFSETTESVDTFFLYENGVMTSYPSGKTIDYKGSVPQDGGIVLHSDGSITLSIHDGSNCAVKTKTAQTVTVSTIDKATCISNIYYKQSSAPFNNLLTNGDFSSGVWTGGSCAGCTTSISNGRLKILGNGVDINPQYQHISLGNNISGNIYYLKSSFMVDNSSATQVEVRVRSISWGGSGYINALKASPASNIWYDISTTAIGDGNGMFFVFEHNYNSTTIANNKAAYFDNIIFLNLSTTYGAGNEPTKQEMDNNLNKVWIDSSTNTPKRFTAGGWINF